MAGFLIITGLLVIAALITALLARKSFNDIKPPTLAMAEFEKTKEALSGALGSPDTVEIDVVIEPPSASGR